MIAGLAASACCAFIAAVLWVVDSTVVSFVSVVNLEGIRFSIFRDAEMQKGLRRPACHAWTTKP
jgi:hypothetical protein